MPFFAALLLGAAAQAPALDAHSAPALDARSIRAVHFDLLGRPPLAAETRRWSGRPLEELADALLATQEHWRHWYREQLYYFLLVDNFAPRGEGLVTLPAELAAGGTDVRDALHRIALSPNFDQRNPGADTFVTVVMEQLCGLEVDRHRRELEIGKKLYDGLPGTFLGAAGSSQSDVLRAAVESRDFAKHFLRREHARIVHAIPEPRALAEWSAALQREPSSYPAILRGWLVSGAYRARLERRHELENRAFVRALFVDLLGRVPGDEEVEPLREALDALSDPLPLRGILARTLIDSKHGGAAAPERPADPSAWVRERFLALLGREPSPAELEPFRAVAADPASGPGLCLLALVTDPEYARY